MKLEGRSVLLTGATGGLGHAIARALAQRGARLVLTGRRTDVLEPLAQELEARSLAVDLSDRSALDPLVEQAANVDVLVANAGIPADGPIDGYDVEQIDRALDVNLRAPILLAKALSELMVERGEGHIVFMSSLSGKAATHGSALYSATKYGLRGFAFGMRQDLHSSGVGVSTIFPGPISDAGMFAETGAKMPTGTGTKKPEHVARAVVRAIERNRAEIDVATVPLRWGSAFAGVAPSIAERVSRRLGAEKVAHDIAMSDAHQSKR